MWVVLIFLVESDVMRVLIDGEGVPVLIIDRGAHLIHSMKGSQIHVLIENKEIKNCLCYTYAKTK